MAKTKVILYANNYFKYRLEGSQTWIPLVGGVEHIIEFDSGDRVELTSIKSVSKIKIRGAIKNIEIFSSDITSLEGAFEGTKELDFANVNSSLEIINMREAFKDSGVLTFDIQTTNVINFDDAFNGTSRIENIDIDTSSANSMDRAFKDSNVKKINNIMPYRGRKINQIFLNDKNLEEIDAIDLSTASDETLNSGVKYANKLITGLDIMFFRGKISTRKKYFFIKENTIHDEFEFEVDIDGNINESSMRNIFELIQNVDTSFNYGANELEIDIQQGRVALEKSNRDLIILDNNGTDDSFDLATNELEIDIDIGLNNMDTRNNEEIEQTVITDDSFDDNTYELELDIDSLKIGNIREKNNITTPTDDSFDDNTYELELDIDSLKNNSIREEINIVTQTDDSFDNSKNIEIDITAGSYDEDPLGDNSLVFMTDTFSINDMISDTPLTLDGSSSSIDNCFLGQKQKELNINCQSVELSNYMLSNFSFEYHAGSSGFIQYIDNPHSKIYIIIYSNGNLQIQINKSPVLDINNVDTSGVFNFCRDGDNYYIYVNNELVGSGVMALSPFNQNGIIRTKLNGNGKIWNIRAFNRYITQNDVLALNSN